MASVDIRRVRKRFGETEVLHGVDIAIRHGEFVVLVGPSGCGKSTLLRMIAGLESITEGEIAIDGRVVNGVPPKQRDVAMVFQNYALYPHMSVYDNMAFSLKLRRMDKAEVDRLVQRAAGILGLTALLQRYPRQLSGGQRQRVAMGRAIVRDPQLFLFDEPLSNLDAKLRVQMRTEIKALHQQLKSTSVYVTHDQVEAMTMADRIVVMHDGIVEQIGAPLELYDNPVNTFVASFIGSPAMNLLRGTVIRDGAGGPAVATGDGMLLPVPPSAPVREGAPVIYGVRPEHLELSPNGVGLPVEVNVVEPTGADTVVFGRMGAAEICAEFTERHAFTPGQQIRLLPHMDAVHLFDEASGRRL
jgi:multiple sugar transport system ATP-binding protein